MRSGNLVGVCLARLLGSWPEAFDAVADVALNVSASLSASRVERDPLSGTEHTMKYTVYGDARADGLVEGCVTLLRDALARADGSKAYRVWGRGGMSTTQPFVWVAFL